MFWLAAAGRLFGGNRVTFEALESRSAVSNHIAKPDLEAFDTEFHCVNHNTPRLGTIAPGKRQYP
jgi:hypothetical protein